MRTNLIFFQPQAPLRARTAQAELDVERLRRKQTGEEFEALLIEMMVREMRKTVPESPLFGKERGREIFMEFLDGEYGRLMAHRGGIGVADFLLSHLGDEPAEKKLAPGVQVVEKMTDVENKRVFGGQGASEKTAEPNLPATLIR